MKRLNLLATALLLAVTFNVNAQQLTFESYASKSIYSFIRYVNWPADLNNQDFKVAVIGDYKVYEELNKLLANRKNNNHNFVVTFVKKATDYSGFNHIVFVDAYQNTKMDALITTLGQQNTLVIAEVEGATQKGAMINFVPRNGTIKFELSRQNIESQGLSVDSRLASMAIPAN